MKINKFWMKVFVYSFLVLILLSCRLPFDLSGRGSGSDNGMASEPEIEITISTDIVVQEPTMPEPTPTTTPDPLMGLPEHVREAIAWETSFNDDFSDDSKGWFTSEIANDDSYQSREIANGQYFWTQEILEAWDDNWINLAVIPNRISVTDIYMSVTAQLVEGYADTGYGFVFRQSGGGSYQFLVRGDTFSLMAADSSNSTPVIDWTPSDAINPGEMNELAVVANGENISLFINQEMVADIVDSTYSWGRMMLGSDLQVEGERTTIAFENVLIKTRAATIYSEIVDWGNVLQENFSTNENGWYIGDFSTEIYNGRISIENNHYLVDITAKRPFVQTSIPEEMNLMEDFYLSVDTVINEGSPGSYYGLVFRQNDNGYYFLRLDEDEFGYFFDVLLFYEGEWNTLVPWQSLINVVKKGEETRLGVVGQDDRFVILINETAVVEFKDSTLSSGKMGIGVGQTEQGARGVWEFMNFQVASPNGMDTVDEPTQPTIQVEVQPTSGAAAQPDSTQSVNPKDNANMVYIPAGEFLMGYEGSGAEEDEGPEHTVYLDDFWLYETPVTNSQYRQCIQDGICTGTLSRFPDDQYPVTRIDWAQAVAYCDYAGGRLPTEAEWEKGARGTDGRLFPWGDQSPTCNLANYQGCYGNKATEVGRFPDGASPYGALDMLGLVWEWVSDWYDEDYYNYSPAQNPTGPVEGQFRSQRGHSFESNLIYLRLTDRGRSDPTSVDYRKGFRCVLPDLP